MQLKAKQDFSWAHRGVQVEQFAKGQIIDTEDDDLIAVATKEGWAEKAKPLSKAEHKKALETRVAELEAGLVDASAADEPAVETALAETRAALAAL